MRTRKVATLSALVAVVIIAAGCSTIYFHNGGTSTSVDYDRFHHIGIFGIVEFSDPVDLDRLCDGKQWETVRTRLSFLNGLVGMFTQPIYGPWEVAYRCRQ